MHAAYISSGDLLIDSMSNCHTCGLDVCMHVCMNTRRLINSLHDKGILMNMLDVEI